MRPNTAAVHAGRGNLGQAHVPPIDLSSSLINSPVVTEEESMRESLMLKNQSDSIIRPLYQRNCFNFESYQN